MITENLSSESLHYENDPAGTTGSQMFVGDNLGKDSPLIHTSGNNDVTNQF